MNKFDTLVEQTLNEEDYAVAVAKMTPKGLTKEKEILAAAYKAMKADVGSKRAHFFANDPDFYTDVLQHYKSVK